MNSLSLLRGNSLRWFAAAVTGVNLALLNVYANAASVLDAALMDSYMESFTDTVDDAKAWIIGGVFFLALAGFAINITKRGTGKMGGRF